jgi:transposase-like protein
VSNLNQKVYDRIEKWRTRKLEGTYPYLYLDGICLKRSWGGEVKNVSVLVAIGVNTDGYREIIGAAEGEKEDKSGWQAFLRHLKKRGLRGVRLIVSDKCLGLVESAAEVFPDSDWQRCVVHWYRNIFKNVPRQKVRLVAAMLKAIHAQEDRNAALEKSKAVVEKLKEMKLYKAAEHVRDSADETLSYMSYPEEYWVRIRTNNPLERIMREIRRRTRVVGSFPDEKSALMLVAARLRHIAGTKWGTRCYLSMERLYELEQEKAA